PPRLKEVESLRMLDGAEDCMLIPANHGQHDIFRIQLGDDLQKLLETRVANGLPAFPMRLEQAVDRERNCPALVQPPLYSPLNRVAVAVAKKEDDRLTL